MVMEMTRFIFVALFKYRDITVRVSAEQRSEDVFVISCFDRMHQSSSRGSPTSFRLSKSTHAEFRRLHVRVFANLLVS